MKPLLFFVIQVRKEKPSKTPPRTTTAEATQLRSLKSNRGKPMDECTGASRPCKWKQILGTRGTVNPSQQTTRETTTTTNNESSIEFHIDLNRFASAAAQTTPTFGNHMKFGRPDHRDEPAARESSNFKKRAPGPSKDVGASEPPPRAGEATSEMGVPLWQRRSGACKPMSLELKRRVMPSVA